MADTKVIITGDSTGAVNAVKRLHTELGSLTSMSAKIMSTPLFGGAGMFATASVAGIVAITKAAIDTGDALNKMAQKTGMSAEELSKLKYAADLSDVSVEALQKGLTALSVGMAEAATGAGPMAEQYRQLGISVRNADGTMKSSRQVLGELADKFAEMPDGVEKTNLAVAIFGKKLGADMIPLLNSGSAGLKAMGDEAERLGLVISGDMAKKSEEFNDNLERMQKSAKSVGIELTGAVIPAMNRMMQTFLNLRKSGFGASDTANLFFTGIFGSGYKKIVAAYNDAGKEITEDTALTAAKRESIERQLQAKLAELANLRAIAEGKVSAEVLQSDEKRTSTQIQNAEKLRQKFAALWKEYSEKAATAAAEAQKLTEQASETRQTGAEKAAAKRRSALSPEEQQAEIARSFSESAGAAESAAALSRLAASQGRAENAAKLAKQAENDAARAAKLAEQIDDPEAGAQAIERAAELQAQLLEAQAASKKQEQQQYEAQAAGAKKNVDELAASIAELQQKAAAVKVEADIAAAQGAIAQLQTQLDGLKDKTVNVTVNTTSLAGVEAASGSGGATSGFASGGYTGPGGKWQPAGIVHAGEYVLRQEVVRQRGALEFLARFNRLGVSALNGYANGGLVSSLPMPSLASGSSSRKAAAVFNFNGLGSFPVQMEDNVLSGLSTAMKRAALKRGTRN